MPFKHPLIPPFLDRSWWDSWDYPSILRDQHFGMVLKDKDLYLPVVKQGYTVRSRTRAAIRSSGKSEVLNDKDKFLVKLSVSDFKLEELKVKVCGNHVIIEGKHEERDDDHGSVEREFSRRYVLPVDSDHDAIKCIFSGTDGTLAIETPKLPADLPPPDEKQIPIMLAELVKNDSKFSEPV